MAQTVASFDTQHEAMIHDAQLDYYGKRLATASSDHSIKIFDVVGDTQVQIAHLKGHEGPVWQVAWGHPKFGNILASCGYDRKVVIWKEAGHNAWNKIYEYTGHESSVNALAFAPWEYGLILACCSSDGKISVLSRRPDDNWDVSAFDAHNIGVNGISWAPASSPALLTAAQNSANPAAALAPKRLVSGGCDNNVIVWKFVDVENKWQVEERLTGHKDWVRDVAWAPSVTTGTHTVASCSEDGTVLIWSQAEGSAAWTSTALALNSPVWRVSWSITGNILAAACGDNKVYLFKENVEGAWEQISAMTEGGVVQAAPAPSN